MISNDINVNNLVGHSVLTVVICPCCSKHMDVVAKGPLNRYILECHNADCALYKDWRIVVRKGKILQVNHCV